VVFVFQNSYWKQFEEGTLSQRGVEHLDDLTDIVLHNDSGIIGADDIVPYLKNERWSGLVCIFQRREKNSLEN
jgi:hypothetical protein